MVKTNMSSNGPSLGPDPNSDSRKLSCRSETAVPRLVSSNQSPFSLCSEFRPIKSLVTVAEEYETNLEQSMNI